jgi:hypothetical protein
MSKLAILNMNFRLLDMPPQGAFVVQLGQCRRYEGNDADELPTNICHTQVPFACHLERTELFLIFVTSWLLQICGTKTIQWLATFHQGF